jgi:hypothetical protein
MPAKARALAITARFVEALITCVGHTKQRWWRDVSMDANTKEASKSE